MPAHSGKRRVVSPILRLALILGVVVHLVGFLLFRVIFSDLPEQPSEGAFIAYAPLDSEAGGFDLEEQAALFDSAPLFIPGRWSSASLVLPSSESLGLEVFPDFEPEMNLAEDLRPGRIEFQTGSEVREPEDLLELRHWDFFRNFSLGAVDQFVFDGWAPVAEVRVLSGESRGADKVILLDLPEDVVSQPLAVSGSPVFSISMVAKGVLLSDVLTIQSSGSTSVDEAARAWLRAPKTLARLPAGLLEVRVFL
jgi:hypothetical protein